MPLVYLFEELCEFQLVCRVLDRGELPQLCERLHIPVTHLRHHHSPLKPIPLPAEIVRVPAMARAIALPPISTCTTTSSPKGFSLGEAKQKNLYTS